MEKNKLRANFTRVHNNDQWFYPSLSLSHTHTNIHTFSLNRENSVKKKLQKWNVWNLKTIQKIWNR